MIGSMFRKAWYSDSATLNLDFTSGVLDSRLTFTRAANTATVINSSGLVQTVNADVPRFDYDPTTLAPKGLLIEGTSSTLNQWGEDYTNAYWTKVGSSVSATSVTGPDNVSTATRRIVESATTAQHGIRRGIATTAGQAYTVSVFVKPGSYDSFGFELFWSASYNAKAEVTSISGNTQTVTSASGVNATLTRTVLAASGWYRYALTFTHPLAVGAATPDFNVLVKQTAAYAGNGTNYMDVYGFMLESGSGSSYIPTGANQVTRNADECSMTGTNFSDWFNASEGTFLARFRPLVQNVGTTNTVISANDNTGNEQIRLASVNNGRFLVTDGGSTLANITSGTVTLGSVARLAGAYKLNDCQCCTGGVLGIADTSVTIPTVDRLFIGRSAGASPIFLLGHIESLKFYPTRLPDATLQSLTT